MDEPIRVFCDDEHGEFLTYWIFDTASSRSYIFTGLVKQENTASRVKRGERTGESKKKQLFHYSYNAVRLLIGKNFSYMNKYNKFGF